MMMSEEFFVYQGRIEMDFLVYVCFMERVGGVKYL